jgi:hypothetical protein
MCGSAFHPPRARKARRVAPAWQQRCAIRTLVRIFWRGLDQLDYLIMQARLWAIDLVCGPEPDTPAVAPPTTTVED